jgi:PAS domain S-box-containing protein
VQDKKRTLAGIREQMWRMEDQSGLDGLMAAMGEGLVSVGVHYDFFGVNTITPEEDVLTFTMNRAGAWHKRNLRRGRDQILEIWQRGGVTYRRDLREVDEYHELPQLANVRSVLDVCFSHGTVSVSNKTPHAFSDEDVQVLTEIAGALSGAFTRLGDIERLRESESRMKLALEGADLGTWDWDITTGHVTFNERWAEMLGYRLEEIEPHKSVWERLVHPDDRPQAMSSGEKRLRHKSGDWIWVLDRGRVIARDGDGKPLRACGTHLDITERKRLEQKVIELERMRVSGELAAGVSHNLNNILSAILGPAQYLLRKSVDPLVLREAEAILTAGSRAADLVQRLNDSTRVGRGAPLGPVSLNERVEQVILMARPRWKDGPESHGVAVEVLTELAETPEIRGNPAELGDAILNLLLNAVDAMPEGGAVTIATQAVKAGAQLTVSDTGMGMDEETRRRVFEPLFTTKMDVGSGLGLSTVHGIVTRWGGTIEVDSSPGEGTTFTLCFPAWAGSATPAEPSAGAGGSVRSGRLLIVEDDEEVSGMLDRLLSETHTVTAVAGGREALDQFVPGQYDVALIDLGMPGMTGDQVAERMRQLDPSVATVLTTGWVLEQEDARLRWFDFQIPKPFGDLDEVESVVAEAIERHDERG